MRPQKIIWLCDEAHPERLGQWQTALASLDYIEVTSPTAVKNILAVEDIDCVLVMGDVPGYSATEFLEFVQAISPRVPVIFSDQDITAATVIQLIRAGAFHCFSTRDSMEAVRQAVVQALETRRTQARQARTAANGRPIEIIGESRAIEDVLNTISLVGQRRCTVLITGETGTGKEMVARALHASSPRAAKAMVSVNCSALPENLLEAELFGHVKGAFTGAVAGRIGRFEQAHQSTLFLDEIGELPLELQPKLLRALQEREVQRLGSSDTIKIDVRVVAATNVDLQEKVRQGKFREDLYYRLNVVPLHIPALRDRRSDIPSLVTHFLAKICQLEGIPQKRITPEAARLLCELPWPGNVRQLENIVEAAIALSGDRILLAERDFGLVPSSVPSKPMDLATTSRIIRSGFAAGFEAAVNEFEKSLLEEALLKAQGNKTAAAEMLGMKRTTLVMKLRNFQDTSSRLAVAQ